MKKIDLLNSLTDVWLRIESSKGLVDDGKEVLCSQKLQGALTCLSNIIGLISKEIKETGNNELV